MVLTVLGGLPGHSSSINWSVLTMALALAPSNASTCRSLAALIGIRCQVDVPFGPWLTLRVPRRPIRTCSPNICVSGRSRFCDDCIVDLRYSWRFKGASSHDDSHDRRAYLFEVTGSLAGRPPEGDRLRQSAASRPPI